MARKKAENGRAAKVKRFVQELQTDLSADEQKLAAKRLAVLLQRIDLQREANKAAAKKLKDELTSLDVERGKLIAAVDTGKEPRQVECEQTEDFATNRIIIVRTDTNKIVSERAMTPGEREASAQQELPEPDPEEQPQAEA